MLFTGSHVPYTEGGHQNTFLTRLPDTVCDVSVQVENIDLRKLNGLELHLKMDHMYSPIY